MIGVHLPHYTSTVFSEPHGQIEPQHTSCAWSGFNASSDGTVEHDWAKNKLFSTRATEREAPRALKTITMISTDHPAYSMEDTVCATKLTCNPMRWESHKNYVNVSSDQKGFGDY